jgi:hypothetical protein
VSVPGLPSASRRIFVVTDIERFSGRGNVNQLAMERNLSEIARQAISHAQLHWRDVEVEYKGDGLLLQLPPGADEPRVIPALITGHLLAVRLANLRAPGSQRIRLRMALTQGISHPGPTGSVGSAVIAACRLADCAELRAAFAPHPHRDLGLIVADDLYRDVIAHGYPGLAPAAFTMVKVGIPEKGFAEQAWTCVPEPASGALRPGPKDTRAIRAAASAAGIAAAGALAGGLIEAGLRDHADPPAVENPDFDAGSPIPGSPEPEHDGYFDGPHFY